MRYPLSASSFAILGILCLSAPIPSQAALVSESIAQQAGLTRAWFTQAQLDPSLGAVVGTRLEGSTLYLLTSTGRLQALDAETGRTQWSTRVGEPGQLNYGPSVFNDRVALVNGSKLYVLDTTHGREVTSMRIGGAAGAGPALSESHVFVPLVNGQMEGFPLDKKQRLIWRFAPGGNVFQAPTVIAEHVVWTTGRGELHGAHANGKGTTYRFRTDGPLIAPPTSNGDTILIASAGGVLYAIDANLGRQVWRTTVGVRINRPATAIGNMVYVGTEEPELHAIEASSGTERWILPGVEEVVGVASDKVYAVGPTGRMAVIDIASGDLLASWQTGEHLTPVRNDQTDWLYLVSKSGLVQCLHEIGSERPMRHGEADPADLPAEDLADTPEAVDVPPPGEESSVDPFATDPEPVEEAAAEVVPAAEEDPFGSGFGEEGEDPFADF